jgi:hypothetical protein
LLATLMWPPLWVMMPYTLASPSPVPRGFVVKNGSNTRRRVSLSIPAPVSLTLRRT